MPFGRNIPTSRVICAEKQLQNAKWQKTKANGANANCAGSSDIKSAKDKQLGRTVRREVASASVTEPAASISDRRNEKHEDFRDRLS